MTASSLPEIAIVGMSALFPKADSLQSYWQNILNRIRAITTADEDWAQSYFDPDSQENDRIYTREGGFLGDLAQFNPIEFGVMPNSVDGGEPDQFLALRLAKAALADAGYLDRPFDGDRTGVILGRGTYINRGYNTLLQHGQIIDQTLGLIKQLMPELPPETLKTIRADLKATLPPFDAQMAPGLVPNVIAGRIANRFDLKGPSYIIDAACASSLIAIDAAVRELQEGRCDLMLSGGIHASTPPQINMIFCQIGALAKSEFAPFGADASGTLLGEGLGMLVLKRLTDAERDGDRIYAVIKGVGLSSDGKGLGLLAPRPEGEVAALQRAYQQSGIEPTSIGLIEAHGTGIPLGDRTEVASLATVFGQRQGWLPNCAIGSVKSSIGHCIPAAGVAGTIKAALALHHKILPPTLGNSINPALKLEETPFYLNTEARPWIQGTQSPRRAGINSFGFGGINAHLILEEYAAEPALRVQTDWPCELIVLAADSPEGLRSQAAELQQLAATQSLAQLADHAKSAQGTHRLALIAEDPQQLQAQLEDAIAAIDGGIPLKTRWRKGLYAATNSHLASAEQTALLFPGEGSQYINMLSDLCQYFPQVRSWFDFLDTTFAERNIHPPSSIIFPAPALNLQSEQQRQVEAELFHMDLASETVFTASMALYELLCGFGIQAKAMLGHSTGENTALIASGTLRLPDRQALGQAMQHFNGIYLQLAEQDAIPKGALLSVGAIEQALLEQTLQAAEGQLHLAMHNCSNQAILFGQPATISGAMQTLQTAGGICSLLPFDRAYHTSLFQPVSDVFREFYQAVDMGTGHTPLYSCVTAQPFPTDAEAIRSLAANQWSSQVRFWQTIEQLYSDGIRTFLEVGPSSNLTGFTTDILRSQPHLALASNHRQRSGLKQLLSLLANLFVNGADLNFDPLYQRSGLRQPAAASHPGTLKMDLTMPSLSLTAETVEQVQANRQTNHPTPATTPIETTAQVIAPPETTQDKAVVPKLATLASPITNPPTSSGTHLANQHLVNQHLLLLQDFSQMQNRLSERLPQSLIQTQLAQVQPTQAQIVQPIEEKFPLLGNILQQSDPPQETPCRRTLYAERSFNLNQDPFLEDHTLGSQLSTYRPEQLPLPVIPFTISMEIISEAALALAGDHLQVVGLSHIRGYRWLALDQGDIHLGIQAEISSQSSTQSPNEETVVIVKMTQQTQPKADQSETNRPAAASPIVFEGKVHLRPQFPVAPAPLDLPLTDLKSSCWPDEQLYTTGMFHGPRFQGVRHIRGWNQSGIEADLQVIETADFFKAVNQPRFQLDSGLLDAAGQLVGYWISEQFGTDFNVFPFMVEAFDQYEGPLPEGSQIDCRAQIEFTSDRFTTAAFDFLHQGRVIARLTGWQDRYFTVPHRYYQCRLSPQTAFLSEAWSLSSHIIRRVAPFPTGFLDDGWSIWKRVLAHLTLTPAEQAIWYKFPEKGIRRTDWLLGRIAAKDALRQWSYQHLGIQLAPVDIEILPNAQGKPIAQCPALTHSPQGVETPIQLPDISISHSDGTAVAAIAQANEQIGIDWQPLSAIRDVDAMAQAFTPAELSLYTHIDRHALARLWAAKEAAAKAIGTGLAGNPQQWIVEAIAPNGHEVVIVYQSQELLVQLWFDEETESVLALCATPIASKDRRRRSLQPVLL